MGYHGKAQSDQSTKKLLSTHYVFQQMLSAYYMPRWKSLSERSQGGWQYNTIRYNTIQYRGGLQENNNFTECTGDRRDDVGPLTEPTV